MCEEQAQKLLSKVVSFYLPLVRDDADDKAQALVSCICCYGGDSTFLLMDHYKKDLLQAVREELTRR